jgi:hypothetical protein
MSDRDEDELFPNRFEFSYEEPPTSTPSEFDRFLDIQNGAAGKVIALEISNVQSQRRVDLVAIEMRESGAILTFRASGDRQVLDEMLWLTWTCEVADDLSTAYRTLSVGEGQSELWRGEVFVHPAPPKLAQRLSVELRCKGTGDDVWSFDFPLG